MTRARCDVVASVQYANKVGLMREEQVHSPGVDIYRHNMRRHGVVLWMAASRGQGCVVLYPFVRGVFASTQMPRELDARTRLPQPCRDMQVGICVMAWDGRHLRD